MTRQPEQAAHTDPSAPHPPDTHRPSDQAPTGTDPASLVTALVMELYRQATALAAELQTRSGMAPSDVHALRLLDAAAGAGTPVNQLGARLGLSSGAVTALVDRLEAAGLAQRTRDSTDRRRVLVTLGPTAAAFGAQHLQPVADRLSTAVGARTPTELTAIAAFLSDLLPPSSRQPAHRATPRP